MLFYFYRIIYAILNHMLIYIFTNILIILAVIHRDRVSFSAPWGSKVTPIEKQPANTQKNHDRVHRKSIEVDDDK